MPGLRDNPLWNPPTSDAVRAALIRACGDVFATAHAHDADGSAADRDETGAAAVAAFLAALAK